MKYFNFICNDNSTLNCKTPYILMIESQSLDYTFRSVGTADECVENNLDHEVSFR